jgi:hypothetical protein
MERIGRTGRTTPASYTPNRVSGRLANGRRPPERSGRTTRSATAPGVNCLTEGQIVAVHVCLEEVSRPQIVSLPSKRPLPADLCALARYVESGQPRALGKWCRLPLVHGIALALGEVLAGRQRATCASSASAAPTWLARIEATRRAASGALRPETGSRTNRP